MQWSNASVCTTLFFSLELKWSLFLNIKILYYISQTQHSLLCLTYIISYFDTYDCTHNGDEPPKVCSYFLLSTNQPTLSCPRTKHGFHRFWPNIFSGGPWDLWIFTVKQSLTWNRILFNANGHADGIISILRMNTFCPVTRPVMTRFYDITNVIEGVPSCTTQLYF